MIFAFQVLPRLERRLLQLDMHYLLFNLNKEKQTTLVIVTHDLLLAQK